MEDNGVAPVLQARGIHKWFGPLHVLKNVDFAIRPGEVVALIGDNGAGKSTLINVLTGVMKPDEGEILFEGQHITFASPHEARVHGIETVYQDLAVAPQLNAVGNIFLGRERLMGGLLGKLGFLDNRSMRREAEEQLTRLNVRLVDLQRPLITLSGGQRLGVAVARAVMWASKVVIMDEPTAALGVAQTTMVMNLIRSVRDTGVPVLVISHNMPNVFEFADRIVVLRLGQVAAHLDPQHNSMEDAVAAMTGAYKGAMSIAEEEI